MVYKRVLLILAIVAVLFTPSTARSADVDDLKAAFDQLTKALNARDLDAVMAGLHDQVVTFGASSPFPADGKAAARQTLQAVFANNESITVTPVNPQFRVTGNTGVAWGHVSLVTKPKDGPVATTYARYTFTYTKTDGKWLRVAQHISRIPSGN